MNWTKKNKEKKGEKELLTKITTNVYTMNKNKIVRLVAEVCTVNQKEDKESTTQKFSE